MKHSAWEFFEDDKSRLSIMRAYGLISLIVAIVLTFNSGSYEMVLTYLIIAIGGKSTQKLIEKMPERSGKLKESK